jgi:hypothetical protein
MQAKTPAVPEERARYIKGVTKGNRLFAQRQARTPSAAQFTTHGSTTNRSPQKEFLHPAFPFRVIDRARLFPLRLSLRR